MMSPCEKNRPVGEPLECPCREKKGQGALRHQTLNEEIPWEVGAPTLPTSGNGSEVNFLEEVSIF